jgi:hypothetical protein
MRNLLIIAIFIVPLTTIGQSNINVGQGLVKIEFEKLPTLLFYSDTNKTTPLRTVSVTKDKEGEFIIENSSHVRSWFNPEGLWLDYGIFIIRVDTVIGKWYRVFTNNDKGTTLWTKADSVNNFIKWQTFLVDETTSINIHQDFDLEIKTEPSDEALTIKIIEETDCFEAIEIMGDWLRIKTNESFECNESKKPIKSGWIKWRRNNRLLINYGLGC